MEISPLECKEDSGHLSISRQSLYGGEIEYKQLRASNIRCRRKH